MQIMRYLNARNGIVLDDGILVQHHANFRQADGLTAWAMVMLELRLVVGKNNINYCGYQTLVSLMKILSMVTYLITTVVRYQLVMDYKIFAQAGYTHVRIHQFRSKLIPAPISTQSPSSPL